MEGGDGSRRALWGLWGLWGLWWFRGSRPYCGTVRCRVLRRRAVDSRTPLGQAWRRGDAVGAVRTAPGPSGRRGGSSDAVRSVLVGTCSAGGALVDRRLGWRRRWARGSGRVRLRARGRQRPEAELLGQVASCAQPLPVGIAGRAAAMMRFDMIDLPDDRVAPGGAAGDVTPPDHPREPGREGACLRIHADQIACARAGVEPPVEGADRLVEVAVVRGAQEARGSAPQGVGDDVRRDSSVALELRAFGGVLATQQSGFRDHDTELQSRRPARAPCALRRLFGAAQHRIDEEVRLERGDRILGPGGAQ